MSTVFIPPAWVFEFHGHQCPFIPLGYRMGRLAMEKLGVEREPDHGFFVFPELGEGHPQTCLMDGLQVATGTTYGKVMIAKIFYGKLAATFYKPGNVRLRRAAHSGKLHRQPALPADLRPANRRWPARQHAGRICRVLPVSPARTGLRQGGAHRSRHGPR